MSSTLLSLAAALLCTASGVTKVALVPLPVGSGLDDKAAAAITEAITGEIRRVPGVKLITQDEITALVGLERQKGLLGCADDKCMTEIGGALGVDRLVTCRLSKVGETWMFTMKSLDPNKALVVAQADRNVRKASIDDMIELIPTMVGELFGAAPAKGPVRTVDAPKADPVRPAEPAPAAPTATPIKHGPNFLDEPLDKQTRTDDLKLVTNGKGLYVALPPKHEGAGVRVFSGDGKSFWAAVTTGGGANGSAGTFEHSLWDPRYRDGFGIDGSFRRTAEGRFLLTCGDKKKTEVELKPVPEAEARKLLKGARFFKARWKRQSLALARDEDGQFFFVDQLRDSDPASDLRFYMGSKGKMQGFELVDHTADSAAEVFITSAGKLKRVITAEDRTKGEWIVGAQKTPVTFVDLRGLGTSQLIYTALGVYAGERLGQPCDAVYLK